MGHLLFFIVFPPSGGASQNETWILSSKVMSRVLDMPVDAPKKVV